MKKIHLLVVQAFIRPFIVTFFIVMFVLLMLFLFKYVDDMIGKGFEISVIAKLMWYASATNVAMALPLSMLLSSIMTFGTLGENYELVAIKSAGISLQKAMMPLIILVGLLSIGAFAFSNYMLPKINLKMGTLLFNVRSQKATFLIKEGVFNDSFPGYSLRVKKKDEDGETLHGILIYDHNNSNGNVVTIMAKNGKMYRTDDLKYLVLRLNDVVRYEEKANERTSNPRQIFMRTRFRQTEQKFDLSIFSPEQLPEDAFRSNYKMLDLKSLRQNKDSVINMMNSNKKQIYINLTPLYSFFGGNGKFVKKSSKTPVRKYTHSAVELIPPGFRSSVMQSGNAECDRMIESLMSIKEAEDDHYMMIRRYTIEYQRKFTLAFSCLMLFSIGAPLGAIIRKGGLGMPVVMSIIFFLIYYIISTIAEKSAVEGSINTILGMWLAIILLTPLGIFLTYKATIDSSLFNIDIYKQFIMRLFKRADA